MFFYRICNSQYANDISGVGAKLYGGRWNSIGNAVLYASSTRALAALEVLVHLLPKNAQRINFSVIAIEAPENSMKEITYDNIEYELMQNGFDSNFKFIGDNWLKQNTSLLLKVPSIVIPEEFNYLINPLHPDFTKVKVVETKSFSFDKRLIVK